MTSRILILSVIEEHYLSPARASSGLVLLSAFLVFQPVVAFLVHEEVDYANHLTYLKPDMDMQALHADFLCWAGVSLFVAVAQPAPPQQFSMR